MEKEKYLKKKKKKEKKKTKKQPTKAQSIEGFQNLPPKLQLYHSHFINKTPLYLEDGYSSASFHCNQHPRPASILGSHSKSQSSKATNLKTSSKYSCFSLQFKTKAKRTSKAKVKKDDIDFIPELSQANLKTTSSSHNRAKSKRTLQKSTSLVKSKSKGSKCGVSKTVSLKEFLENQQVPKTTSKADLEADYEANLKRKAEIDAKIVANQENITELKVILLAGLKRKTKKAAQRRLSTSEKTLAGNANDDSQDHSKYMRSKLHIQSLLKSESESQVALGRFLETHCEPRTADEPEFDAALTEFLEHQIKLEVKDQVELTKRKSKIEAELKKAAAEIMRQAEPELQVYVEDEVKEAGIKSEIAFHKSLLQSNMNPEHGTTARLQKTLKSRTSSKTSSLATQVNSVQSPCNQEPKPITTAASKCISPPCAESQELQSGPSQPDVIGGLQKSNLQASQFTSLAASKVISQPSQKGSKINLQNVVKNNSGKIPISTSNSMATVKNAMSPKKATRTYKTNSNAITKPAHNNINTILKNSNCKDTPEPQIIPQDNSVSNMIASLASLTSSSSMSRKGNKTRKHTDIGGDKLKLNSKAPIITQEDNNITLDFQEPITAKDILLDTNSNSVSFGFDISHSLPSSSNPPASSDPPHPLMSTLPHLAPKASTTHHSPLSRSSGKGKKSRKQMNVCGTSKSFIKPIMTQDGKNVKTVCKIPEISAPGNNTATVKAMNFWSKKKSADSSNSYSVPPLEPNNMTSPRNDGNFFVDLMEGVDKFSSDCVIC